MPRIGLGGRAVLPQGCYDIPALASLSHLRTRNHRRSVHVATNDGLAWVFSRAVDRGGRGLLPHRFRAWSGAIQPTFSRCPRLPKDCNDGRAERKAKAFGRPVLQA